MPLPNECVPFKLDGCTAWVNVERLRKCLITQVRYHCSARGEVRELWSAAALVREDKKRSRVEDHYRPFVIKASKELIAYAGSRIRDA